MDCWSHAITGYFSIQASPTWGDGETLYEGGRVSEWMSQDDLYKYYEHLHQTYRESLKGQNLLYKLMDSTVFARSPTPEVAWLLYAKAFAEVDPQRYLR